MYVVWAIFDNASKPSEYWPVCASAVGDGDYWRWGAESSADIHNITNTNQAVRITLQDPYDKTYQQLQEKYLPLSSCYFRWLAKAWCQWQPDNENLMNCSLAIRQKTCFFFWKLFFFRPQQVSMRSQMGVQHFVPNSDTRARREILLSISAEEIETEAWTWSMSSVYFTIKDFRSTINMRCADSWIEHNLSAHFCSSFPPTLGDQDYPSECTVLSPIIAT